MWGRSRHPGRRKQLWCRRVLIRAMWWLWRFLFPPSPPRLTHGWGEGPAADPWQELGYPGLGRGVDRVSWPLSPSPSLEGPGAAASSVPLPLLAPQQTQTASTSPQCTQSASRCPALHPRRLPVTPKRLLPGAPLRPPKMAAYRERGRSYFAPAFAPTNPLAHRIASESLKCSPSPLQTPSTSLIPKASSDFVSPGLLQEGGCGGLWRGVMGATVFVQPLDLVKNRMQLSGAGAKGREYRTSLHALGSILRHEGLRGIYTGYGPPRTPPATTLHLQILGSSLETPWDPPLNLSSLHVLGSVPPSGARAVVVNAAQLASYSQSKQFLLDSGHFRDDILCHFCASMISGLVTTAASMPVDIVKTRIQNMRTIDGKPEYRNGLDVLIKVVRYEGFFSLWKGFTPYYARLGPHTVLTFIFLEQMNKWYQRLFLSA
ncbi:PREDICTED: mitochondrial 2-oxoglutarate/malate carrier protein [Ficedula albicollis]|uniref:mitochondrial 2-oxoglutarate/malate carrier protein n=1 Tax=Ficedula albicollis TaxID=59894 RepID=UPI0007AD81AA|nr:PREDICTED: mitochondrial 2-oxoglutarate/malate carrier protein [Ficedula albicollis]